MDNLQKFNEKKSEILQSLKQAEKFVGKFGLKSIDKDFKIIERTLEREQFEIIVVGEFSNGKSTFINALLQEEILPSSTVPTTALINKIYYREQPVFKVSYKNKKERDLTKQEFLDFVSDDKNKVDGKPPLSIHKRRENLDNISHLEIGYPTSLIENGIVLIDSPGTNDMSEQRVQITNEYIPRSDAAIFLLNASQIFKASEKAFLQRILDADIKKVFFVINFKDLIKSEEEFKEIEEVVKDNLPEGLDTPKIFFVSALHALNHYKKEKGIEEVKPLGRRALRKQGRKMSIEETGIMQFEQQLIQFLSKESGTEKLRKPVERAGRLLRFVSDHIQFERNSLNHNIGDIDSKVKEINKQLKAVERESNHRAKRMMDKMDSDAETILRWYSDELHKVSEIADKKLNDGILRKEDPEVIKNDIDLATAKLEKQISEQLPKKIKLAVNTIISDEDQQLNQKLGQLTQKLIQSSGNKDEWGEKIIRKEEGVEKHSDATIGAAVLGGLALFFTGGTLGWGLVGAGIGGASYHYLTKREEDASMYGRLKEQVKARYVGAVPKQIKELENELKIIGKKLKDEYKQTVQEKIEQERNRTKMLLQNQNLEAKEVQQKIADLDKDLNTCNSIVSDLESIFASYLNSVSYTEVNQDERVRV